MANPTLPRASHKPPITADAFLAAAMDGADLPFLHGRDKTAKKLGISYAEAKRMVRKLADERKIVVQGKRLRLASTNNGNSVFKPDVTRGER